MGSIGDVSLSEFLKEEFSGYNFKEKTFKTLFMDYGRLV